MTVKGKGRRGRKGRGGGGGGEERRGEEWEGEEGNRLTYVSKQRHDKEKKGEPWVPKEFRQNCSSPQLLVSCFVEEFLGFQ